MKQEINIVGGGPAALMLAAHLDENKFKVTIFERNAALGRKFLVAGDGGFNLTHSEDPELFLQRYSPPEFLTDAFTSFNNSGLREWLKANGIETYIGSSKRVFPIKGIKPIDVLNAILNVLDKKGVEIKPNHEWSGWIGNDLEFREKPTIKNQKSSVNIFSLGGSSWKVTGSDGNWTKAFSEKGIRIIPFQPSNCAYQVQWKEDFISQAEGKSLKNISISCKSKSKKGEVVITRFGLEGGAIYALSPEIRKQLKYNKTAEIFIDLKPHLTEEQITDKFSSRGNRSIKKMLIDRLSLDETQIELLKSLLTKEEFTDPEILSKKIKRLPVTITGSAPLDEAISSVGGVDLSEVDRHFQLKKIPGNYCIGEMLDWDAPTGGYLLQACFSMGYYLAQHLNSK
ncbi:MAG: NAD(P)/FAD-dependent oxidoreductase [Bacteroidia bacterium]